eukprot:6581400-Prorocentrum_lima.AAC.1
MKWKERGGRSEDRKEKGVRGEDETPHRQCIWTWICLAPLEHDQHGVERSAVVETKDKEK